MYTQTVVQKHSAGYYITLVPALHLLASPLLLHACPQRESHHMRKTQCIPGICPNTPLEDDTQGCIPGYERRVPLPGDNSFDMGTMKCWWVYEHV